MMGIFENKSLKVMKRIMKSKLLLKKAISLRTQMRMNEILLNQNFSSQYQIRKLATRNDELDEQVSKLWQILDSSNKCAHKNNPTKIDSSLQNPDLIYDRKNKNNNVLSNSSGKNHQNSSESLRDFRKKKANFKVNQQEKQKEVSFKNEINEQQLELKKVESEQDQSFNPIDQSQNLFFSVGNENSRMNYQQSVDTVNNSQTIKIKQNYIDDIQRSGLNSQESNILIMNQKSIQDESVIDKSIKYKQRHYQIFIGESKYKKQIQSQKLQKELPVSIQLMLNTTSQSGIYQQNDNNQFKQNYRSLNSLKKLQKLLQNYKWFRQSQQTQEPTYVIDFSQIQTISQQKIIERFEEFIKQSNKIKDQYQKLNAQVKSITFTSFNHLQLMKECLSNQWLNYQHVIVKQKNIQQNQQHCIDFNEFLQKIVQQFTSQKLTFKIHLDLLFPQYLSAIQQIEIKNHLFIHIKCMTKQTFQILLEKQFKSSKYINIIYNDKCLQNIKKFNLLDIQQNNEKQEFQDQKYLVSLQMYQHDRKIKKIKNQIKQGNQQNLQNVYKIQKDGKFTYKIKNCQLFDVLIRQYQWQEVKQIWFEKLLTVSQWGKFLQRANSFKNLESIFLMKQNKNEFLYHFVKSKDVLNSQNFSKIGFSIHDRFQLADKNMDKQFQFYRIEIISELEHLDSIGSQCFSDSRQMVFSVLNVQLFKNQYLKKSQITVRKNLTDDIK